MVISKAINMLTGQVQSDPRTQFSDIPKDILPHIFRSLPFGDSSAVHFSRVCKEFYSVYTVFSRPIDRLLSSECKTIEFIQKNKINDFVTHGQDNVITVDAEEYNHNQRITIWSSREPPVREINCSFSGYIYKPTDYTAIGGTTIPYFAASQSNIRGKIQVWNLNNKTKVMETNFHHEISSLCGDKEFLLVGFVNGTIGWYHFSDLTRIKELPAHTAPINFIFVDSSIKRMMTSSANCIMIWDLENLYCIKEIILPHSHDLTSYDLETKTLIGVGQRKGEVSVIYFWSAQDGKEMASFHCPNGKAIYTAVHLNAKTDLLFAAFTYVQENPRVTRSGMAVWDLKSKKLLKEFPLLLREDPAADLHEVIYTIDFDPDSGLIMTSHTDIHLWSLEKAIHIKRLDLPKGTTEKILWDKNLHRLFALIDGKLYLKDYSNNPLQIVGEVTN